MKHTLIALLTLAVLALAGPAHADDALRHARELLAEHPLIDGHNDLPYVIREHGRDVESWDLKGEVPGDTNIPKLRDGGVGGQFWSVYIPGTQEAREQGFARIQLEQIDIARRVLAKYPEVFHFSTSVADIEQAREQGKIASLLGMEGGHAIENSLGALRMFYALGVRYMTLTHSQSNDWADAAGQSEHNGLTDFGREVVREMNRLGMLVDLSHVTPKVMQDVLDVSEAPVIYSHSSAHELTPHMRNVPDAVLQRLPDNGGVVMASFIALFNTPGYAEWDAGFTRFRGDVQWGEPEYDGLYEAYIEEHPLPPATVSDVADHIEHIARVAGHDHVGIGSDFFGASEWMVEGLTDADDFPVLFAELVRRGWSDEQLIALSRGNILRAMRAAEQAAGRLQQQRGHRWPP
ncbi:dipeptidase [Kineobactrum salinum]|uniref:Membrane dipeptidase n=1 Tax=Kineobactrum salinum TaxID=2708301 RepID=A0A6C0U746_9GAMM|nr:dipeptidase [Kineobactrum salinum]QIB65294.1 membrane dipeptidase [Kineobactrum salinum]